MTYIIGAKKYKCDICGKEGLQYDDVVIFTNCVKCILCPEPKTEEEKEYRREQISKLPKGA
jgi:hypothetical protein